MRFPAYGVHFRHGADPRAVVRDLDADGWRVFALAASRNKRGFISEAARSLPLDPPVTMPNWDGLEDALRGGIGSLADEAVAIVWRDAHLLKEQDGPAFGVAMSIFTDLVFTLADPELGDSVKRVLVLVLLPPRRPIR